MGIMGVIAMKDKVFFVMTFEQASESNTGIVTTAITQCRNARALFDLIAKLEKDHIHYSVYEGECLLDKSLDC